MKTIAKTLGSIALVLIVVLVYLVAGTRLQVSAANETIIPAAQEPERFAQALRSVKSGEAGDRLYGALGSENIEDYCFITLDVKIGSFGLLPCEWITAGVSPLEGDIALVEYELPDAKPLSRSTTSIWILADAQRAQTGHHVWIEYYAFGYKTYLDAKMR